MQIKLLNKFSIILAIISILFGCQSVKELHYFKSGENYYRLNVRACAFASKSRYIAGYFDENAVDNYFSELSKVDSVSFLQPKTKNLSDSKSGLTAGKDNTKLVMIMSTNSNVISDQIGNLAQNDQTLEMIARLANKDKINENDKIINDINECKDQNKGIIATGDLLINSLTGNITSDTVKILSYLNYISAIKGYGIKFTSIKNALDWANK